MNLESNNTTKDFLYHYTSIESLEKILANRTFRFTSLSEVDDLDEAKTKDMGDFGRLIYISCWTNEDSESIPMWDMYTPKMKGVRIGMKKFPFKKYRILSGQMDNNTDIDTYINIEERDVKDLPYIFHAYPLLTEIEYTEKEYLLYPKIKTEIQNGFEYSFKLLGEFKRKCWSFQKEWRYKILISPYTYKELKNIKTQEEYYNLIRRLENREYKMKERYLYLELDNNSVSNMEILMGPRTSDEEFSKVKDLALNAGIKNEIKKSVLRIR